MAHNTKAWCRWGYVRWRISDQRWTFTKWLSRENVCWSVKFSMNEDQITHSVGSLRIFKRFCSAFHWIPSFSALLVANFCSLKARVKRSTSKVAFVSPSAWTRDVCIYLSQESIKREFSCWSLFTWDCEAVSFCWRVASESKKTRRMLGAM